MENQSTNQLINYTLHLADNSLILGHRNSEWCGHGPVLEQDIAITNIALDLIGQARNFYQYVAQLINKSQNTQVPRVSAVGGDSEAKKRASEDTLAYLRDGHEFKNCLLTEQPNGDWAKTVLRQFFFSIYQYFLLEELKKSKDSQLAAIAEKSLKEVTYHLRWSSEWVIRLGDGTEESHERMLKAVDELWPYTGELFEAANYEQFAAKEGFGANPSSLKTKWEGKVKQIFSEAALAFPKGVLQQTGGKEGRHTENLANILAELQFMQRTYPDSVW
ncbi:MAG TPA: 1,2-phenylacetyl-CoA epoxidase subunit PaaC [Chitinophagaceae bacterium]|jgi:ring-1,2-phenylacetyl-CoA epoxidase subunit PaaC|nr:1,2-phenylacetyl-CoA epoxidase subunit PaaC [Chitinophagaceae bacterium]